MRRRICCGCPPLLLPVLVADGHALPESFTWAMLALLAKKDEQALRPEDTRPMSLSNTGCKLFAAGLQVLVSGGLEEYITPDPFGFMPNRSIVSAVMEQEAAAVEASFVPSTSMLLSFDFTAAFPSIRHDYIFRMLTAIGLPTPFVRAGFALSLWRPHGSLVRPRLLRRSCRARGSGRVARCPLRSSSSCRTR